MPVLVMTVAVAALLWLVGACFLLASVYRKALVAAWTEPVLRAPVLILESDDWGYGPVRQAQRLEQLIALLLQFRDSRGSTPVMTLGLVLAGPATDRLSADGYQRYYRVTLADQRFASVREAILCGVRHKVFALQLHGMEHYWPPCLMSAALTDEKVRNWVTPSEEEFPATERLSPAMQSRWIDSTTLPSRPLPDELATRAATEEVRAYEQIFGSRPEVVVPPTFVWSDTVEAAWISAGVQVVVTPGTRSQGRDEKGRLIPTGLNYFNGGAGRGGVTYVVRDCYLEPSLGHTHEQTLRALQAKTHAGSPTLVEIHRLNFIGDESQAQRAMAEVGKLLKAALAAFPDLRFMSTATLAAHFRQGSVLVEGRVRVRAHYLIRRLCRVSRLRKLAWATGAALPVLLVYVFTRPHKSEAASP